MEAQRTDGAHANGLRGRELVTTVTEECRAPAETVWELLADLRSHLEWGGHRQNESTRILEMDAPEGPATVGTEFRSVGADPLGRFTDRSVVTEAMAPATFEFVTEATLETKKGASSEWTVVHRYELTTFDGGCRIGYTVRITRVTSFPGMLAIFRIPGLRSLGMKASSSVGRRGVRNLARLAEERAEGSRGGRDVTEYEGSVDAFVAAITAGGDTERDERLSQAVVDDLAFFGPEPQEAFRSRGELRDYLAQMSTMLPAGTTVVRTTPVHEHHGQVRWRMAFRLPDGTEAYRFEGFGEGESSGRLRKIVTFDVTQE